MALVLVVLSMLAVAIGYIAMDFMVWCRCPKARDEKTLCKEFPHTPKARRAKVEVDIGKHLVENTPATGKQYLVVGGGFLGAKLTYMLLLRGETKVRLFDLMPYPHKDLKDRVEYIQGDVRNEAELLKACQGVDVVYYNAALLCYYQRLPHQLEKAVAINVGGPRNVIEACKKQNVAKIVYTSTSHVCFIPGKLHLDMDENSPMATKETAPNHYTFTKSLAESTIVSANGATCADGRTKLQTVSIRPCSGIYGHEDKSLFENLVNGKPMMMRDDTV